MRNEIGDRIEKVVVAGKDVMRHLSDATTDEEETDAEAIDAERTGRTNAARDAATGHGPVPGRWDTIGEDGEGLDELQGLYASDASTSEHLAEQESRTSPDRTESSAQRATTITPKLWDLLTTLAGQTIETPKGEPFGVTDVSRGECVTVSPLDGGEQWTVSAHELETAWTMIRDGEPLDRLASIRLQAAGLGSAHPEYVAGILHAIIGDAGSEP